eukprot:jgi/Mesen1/1205/ME000128S00172
MSMILHQSLRGLCCQTGWDYAVFWKLKRSSRLVLTWEDGYYEFGHAEKQHTIHGLGGAVAPGKQTNFDGVDVDMLGVAVAKMAYHVYSFGEGIIGRVAFTGKHQWVFGPQERGGGGGPPQRSTLSEKHPAGWQSQFTAGIKTIAVVAVPQGVVQLGSTAMMMEDLAMVHHMRALFNSLQAVPGAFLSDVVADMQGLGQGQGQGPAAMLQQQQQPQPQGFGMPMVLAPPTMLGGGMSGAAMTAAPVRVQPQQQQQQQQSMVLPPRISLAEASKGHTHQLSKSTPPPHMARVGSFGRSMSGMGGGAGAPGLVADHHHHQQQQQQQQQQAAQPMRSRSSSLLYAAGSSPPPENMLSAALSQAAALSPPHRQQLLAPAAVAAPSAMQVEFAPSPGVGGGGPQQQQQQQGVYPSKRRHTSRAHMEEPAGPRLDNISLRFFSTFGDNAAVPMPWDAPKQQPQALPLALKAEDAVLLPPMMASAAPGTTGLPMSSSAAAAGVSFSSPVMAMPESAPGMMMMPPAVASFGVPQQQQPFGGHLAPATRCDSWSSSSAARSASAPLLEHALADLEDRSALGNGALFASTSASSGIHSLNNVNGSSSRHQLQEVSFADAGLEDGGSAHHHHHHHHHVQQQQLQDLFAGASSSGTNSDVVAAAADWSAVLHPMGGVQQQQKKRKATTLLEDAAASLMFDDSALSCLAGSTRGKSGGDSLSALLAQSLELPILGASLPSFADARCASSRFEEAGAGTGIGTGARDSIMMMGSSDARRQQQHDGNHDEGEGLQELQSHLLFDAGDELSKALGAGFTSRPRPTGAPAPAPAPAPALVSAADHVLHHTQQQQQDVNDLLHAHHHQQQRHQEGLASHTIGTTSASFEDLLAGVSTCTNVVPQRPPQQQQHHHPVASSSGLLDIAAAAATASARCHSDSSMLLTEEKRLLLELMMRREHLLPPLEAELALELAASSAAVPLPLRLKSQVQAQPITGHYSVNTPPPPPAVLLSRGAVELQSGPIGATELQQRRVQPQQQQQQQAGAYVGGSKAAPPVVAAAATSVAAGRAAEEAKGKSGGKRVRCKPGDPPRPRPRDRQQIQDRVKELRDIIPDSAKCSIDVLFEKTINHMRWQQDMVARFSALQEASKAAGADLRTGLDAAEEQAALGVLSGPVNVSALPGHPRHMLVEVLCEAEGLTVEVLDVMRGLGLSVSKGSVETRNGKLWAQFTVVAKQDVHCVQVMWPLMELVKARSPASSMGAATAAGGANTEGSCPWSPGVRSPSALRGSPAAAAAPPPGATSSTDMGPGFSASCSQMVLSKPAGLAC